MNKFSISDVSVRELLHFIFDAGSVVFNKNLTELYQSKDWDIWKVFSDAKTNFEHRKRVFVKVESSVTRNIII